MGKATFLKCPSPIFGHLRYWWNWKSKWELYCQFENQLQYLQVWLLH